MFIRFCWKLKLYKNFIFIFILIVALSIGLYWTANLKNNNLTGILGAIIGILLSGFVSLLNTRAGKNFEINRENSLHRLNTIYLPIFDELSNIHEKMQHSSEFKKLFDFILIEKTKSISNRKFDLPNKRLSKRIKNLVDTVNDYSINNFRASIYNLALENLDDILSDIFNIKRPYQVQEIGQDQKINVRMDVSEEEAILYDEVKQFYRKRINDDFVLENLYENMYPGNNMELYTALLDHVFNAKPDLLPVKQFFHLKSKYQLAVFIINKYPFKEKLIHKKDISKKLEQSNSIMNITKDCLDELEQIIIYIKKKYDFFDV